MSAVTARVVTGGVMMAAAAAAYVVPRVCVYGIEIGEYPYGTPTGCLHQIKALDKAREKMRKNTQVAKLVFGIGVVPTKVGVVPAKVVDGVVPAKVVDGLVNDITTVYPNGNGFVAHMHNEV